MSFSKIADNFKKMDDPSVESFASSVTRLVEKLNGIKVESSIKDLNKLMGTLQRLSVTANNIKNPNFMPMAESTERAFEKLNAINVS